MSIIQEALKKVQSDYAQKKISPPKVKIKQEAVPSDTGKRNLFKALRMKKKLTPMRLTIMSSIMVVFISSMVIVGFGLKLFLLFRETAEKKRNKEVPLAVVTPQNLSQTKAAPAIPKRNKPSYDTAESRPPNFVLNGVMYLDGKPQAIINGYMLEEGDMLNGATVMLIDKDYVLLNLNDSKIKVKMER